MALERINHRCRFSYTQISFDIGRKSTHRDNILKTKIEAILIRYTFVDLGRYDKLLLTAQRSAATHKTESTIE